MLFGRVSRKLSSLIQKQTPANSVVRHDWNFKWHWLLLSDETEKRAFWQQTHQMSLVQTGIKKYPMSTVKYTAGSLMLWACFSAGGPEHLVQMHGIMDSIKYQQIKNQNLTASVRNLIMGRVWIFHQDNNPKQNIKINTKMGHWAQNEYFTMAVSVLWPEPCRRWVRWTEEKKHRHGAVNLKDLERFCMKKMSLISYQVFSKLFRHYRRKLRAVVLGKGRCNNWVPIIVANMK